MKEIIYYIFIFGIFAVNIAELYLSRKQDNSSYRMVYLSRPLDWLLALLVIIFIITSIGILYPYIPEFLKFSLFSLLDKDGTNANIEIINKSNDVSIYLTIIIFLFFALLLPKAAYWEEQKFRQGHENIKQSIWSNIKFGMVHCIIGIPVYVGILLILIGFILTLKYLSTYRKTNSHKLAVESSTSLHGKYNIILVSILALSLILKEVIK